MNQGAQHKQFFVELMDQIGFKSNGVFFVTTDKKRSVTMMLVGGKIIYCRTTKKHGQHAVDELANCLIVKHAFVENDDYPFRPADEVVHELVIHSLEDHIHEAHVQPIKPTNETKDAITPATRIYRGQRIEA